MSALRKPPPRPPATPRSADGQGLLKEAGISVVGWLDERTGASPILRYQLYRKIPKGSDWWGATLGVATLFAFLSQAATGVFLAMFYRPSASEAYASVRHITNDVFLGELVRGMHKWGAGVMLICLFLHMGTNFFIGAYKYPREINWVIGVVLLVLTILIAFTGILLPFDQRAYWATSIGVELNASAPILGPYLADFLRGGTEVGAATLSRFYSLHMLLLPGLVIALVPPTCTSWCGSAPPSLRGSKPTPLRIYRRNRLEHELARRANAADRRPRRGHGGLAAERPSEPAASRDSAIDLRRTLRAARAALHTPGPGAQDLPRAA